MATIVTLAQLNINLGTREELEALADDVGLELEDGMADLDLAQAVCTTIDSKDDTEWEAMGEAAKAWSNRVNATKKAYKATMDKAGSTREQPEGTDTGDAAEDWSSLSNDKLKAKAKELGVTGYSGMNKTKLIAAIDAKLAEAAAPPADETPETPETPEEVVEVPEPTVKELKAKCKALGITGYGGMTKPKLIAAIAAKEAESEKETPATTGEPSKEELEKMKAGAREKADTTTAKKQVVSEKAFKPDTTAWMVTQCVKDAGKTGITQKEVVVAFEKKVKAAKAVCTNPKGRVATILRQALNIKGLVNKKGEKFFPSAKLNKAA